jgi:nitronate monooxygenase
VSVLGELPLPVVQAPMAGGPSTVALAAAVSEAGGLGFLAAGYLTAERMAADVAAARGATPRPFGVNLFVGGGEPADPEAVAAYTARLAPTAAAAGVALGEPRFDDDAFAAKVEALLADTPRVVSFTFGLPDPDAAARLRAAGAELWMTVTNAAEARAAVAALAPDALVVQGLEAGGHRGVFDDADDALELGLLAAVELVADAAPGVPLVAAGGLMTAPAVAAVLAAGAAAAQCGTAYLLADEAGTSATQRAATRTDAPTVLTRAFSGRTARGIVNRWHLEHAGAAPRAYPEVHHVTAPLRAHGRTAGDPDLVNLWAGQGHQLAQAGPAAEITRRLAGA